MADEENLELNELDAAKAKYDATKYGGDDADVDVDILFDDLSDDASVDCI